MKNVQKHLRAVPSDFSRVGSLGALQQMGWAKIPTYYYDVFQHQLPLTQAEFDTNFGSSHRVFSLEDPEAGHQTNAATGSSLNEVFLAMGVGVVAIGEGEAFSQRGVVIDRPATALSGVGVQQYFADGAEGGFNVLPILDANLAPSALNEMPAVFQYGSPTWRFIEKFFQAFRLNIHVNRRFLLVDESLFDVGMVPVPPEFTGASSSQVSAMPLIRETNEIMGEKSIGSLFLPPNILTASTVEEGPTTVDLPAAPPMPDATFGHNKIVGLSNRLYCFTQPLLFVPGLKFDVSFVPVENDIAFKEAMQDISVFSLATGTPDPLIGSTIQANTGEGNADFLDAYGGTMLTNVITVPGGTISLGLVFKGCALAPQACIEYLTEWCCINGGNLAGLYQGNDHISGLIRKAGLSSHEYLGRLLEKDK